MGEERFTEQDVKDVLEKIKTLTPRQQRLLEALIAVALDAGDDRRNDGDGDGDGDGLQGDANAAVAGNEAGTIVVRWPDGQRRRKYYTYFERRFARGTMPDGQGPKSAKIGDAIRFDIDGD